MELTLQQIGKYEILSELGRGGMAVVYLTTDNSTGVEVALKVLPPTLATHENTLQRFEREGQNAARLQHENIVQVYEAGLADGYHYIAMELVRGQPLDERIIENGQLFSLDETVAVLSEIAAGLDYAHSMGIIHRDIKPANVLVSDEGRVMLADFGVARHLFMDTTMYTAAGQSVGTPAYMSPEQARGHDVDFRSDVYSFGVLAYKLLTGRIPFHSSDQLQMMRKVVTETAPPAHEVNPEIPLFISQVIEKCLAKDPADRYESAGAFMGAIMSGYNPDQQVSLLGWAESINGKVRENANNGLSWYDRTIKKLKTRPDMPKVSYGTPKTPVVLPKVSRVKLKRQTKINHPSANIFSGRDLVKSIKRRNQLTLAALTLGVIATAYFYGNAWIDREKALGQLNNVTQQIEERIASADINIDPTELSNKGVDAVKNTVEGVADGSIDPVELSKSGIDTVKDKAATLVESSTEFGATTFDKVNEQAGEIAATIEEQTADMDLPADEIGQVLNTVWYPKHSINKFRQSLAKNFDIAANWISNTISGDPSDENSN